MATTADTSLESPADQSPSHDAPGIAERTVDDLHAGLERALMEEYLASCGHTLRSIDDLPPADREPLLRAATASATLKLAEIEARAHLIERLA